MELIFTIALIITVAALMIFIGFMFAFVGTRTYDYANEKLPAAITGWGRAAVALGFAFIAMQLFARFLTFVADEAATAE